MGISGAKLLQQSSSLRKTELETRVSLQVITVALINWNVGEAGEICVTNRKKSNRRLLWLQNKL